MYTSDDLTSCIEGPVILCTCVCMRTDTELFLLILFRVKKQNNNKKKKPKKTHSVFDLIAVCRRR